MRSLSLLACIAFFLVPTHIARAFDSFEHEQVGNISLMIASNIFSEEVGAENKTEFANVTSAFLRGLGQENTKPRITYGYIVKLVDWMRDPYDMLHMQGSDDHWLTNSSPLTMWPTGVRSCNLGYLLNIESDREFFLGSTHENYNHFQGRALFSFWFWHSQAVKLASEHNLFGGLLLNAYADHFLQDILAPGHILAPRDASTHDLSSLAWHDYYNHRGMNYVLTNMSALLPMIEGALKLAQANGGCIKDLAFISKDPRNTLPVSSKSLTDLLSDSGKPQFSGLFKGDGELCSQTNQANLMCVYCARSSLDILESWNNNRATNSFAMYRWNSDFAEGNPDGTVHPLHELIDFSIGFGGLSCKYGQPQPLTFRQGAVLVTTNLDYPVNANLFADSGNNRLFEFYLGMQSIVNDKGSRLRGFYGAEMLVLGNRPDIERVIHPGLPKWIPDQWAIAAGYSGVADVYEHGDGISTRVIFPITKLNLHVSIIGGERYYYSRFDSGFADFEEFRVDWGLNMLNLFFGIGHDHLAGRDRRLDNGLTFQGGISCAVPYSRIWLAKKLSGYP